MQIAFLGLGEVATALGTALAKVAQVTAYDTLFERPEMRAPLEARARTAGMHLGPLSQTVAEAEYVLSTVTTDAALVAGQAAASQLRPGQTFVDLNSTTPRTKQAIAQAIAPSGAAFVEGAILDAIGTGGARVQILLGGPAAGRATQELGALGLNVACYSGEIGRASTFKLLRSVWAKGIEALLVETLLAAQAAGLDAEIWQEILASMQRAPFERSAANWVCSHALAHERRWHEMEGALAMLGDLGVEPLMTSATAAVLRRSTEVDLRRAFAHAPERVADVIGALAERLGACGSSAATVRDGRYHPTG